MIAQPPAALDGLVRMLNELESHQLQVMLAPLNRSKRGFNEGGCKRVLADQNPIWYRKYCAAHISSRGVRRGKADTKIKRRNTINALTGLIAGTYNGKYSEHLKRIAESKPAG